MQLRAIVMLAIALVLGGITVFLVNSFLQREVGDRSRVQEIRTVPVVVAAADLAVGTRVEPVHLKLVDWPAEAVPEGVFADPTVVIGEKPPVVLVQMRRGEPLLPYKLSPHGARGGLPSRIPEDMRAITIPVNEVSGVGGFIMPGDFVDLMHTSAVGRDDKIPVTRVLLQNIQVLGIDQQSASSKEGAKVVNAVTLLVDTEAGQRVTLAMATGQVSLLLRNEFDASLLGVSDVTWRDLVPFIPEPVKPKVVRRERREPPKVVPQVEVIRGLQVTRQTVPAAPAGQEKQAAPATAE